MSLIDRDTTFAQRDAVIGAWLELDLRDRQLAVLRLSFPQWVISYALAQAGPLRPASSHHSLEGGTPVTAKSTDEKPAAVGPPQLRISLWGIGLHGGVSALMKDLDDQHHKDHKAAS
ncbi:hypothetical protein AB0C28_06065 [Nonomuraea sp. NPDC048892]|uniref:hypothetical protein n=1 Tax=Nonomuraea sp. NPDC048892 TaxID=3154624 RepID=UPI0033ED7558